MATKMTIGDLGLQTIIHTSGIIGDDHISVEALNASGVLETKTLAFSDDIPPININGITPNASGIIELDASQIYVNNKASPLTTVSGELYNVSTVGIPGDYVFNTDFTDLQDFLDTKVNGRTFNGPLSIIIDEEMTSGSNFVFDGITVYGSFNIRYAPPSGTFTYNFIFRNCYAEGPQDCLTFTCFNVPQNISAFYTDVLLIGEYGSLAIDGDSNVYTGMNPTDVLDYVNVERACSLRVLGTCTINTLVNNGTFYIDKHISSNSWSVGSYSGDDGIIIDSRGVADTYLRVNNASDLGIISGLSGYVSGLQVEVDTISGQLSGYIKLVDTNTQYISGDISFAPGTNSAGHPFQLLSNDGTSDISLIGYHTYLTGWEAVEVGDEQRPLTLNGSYNANGAQLEGRPLYNYKDSTNATQADAIPLLEKDIVPIQKQISGLMNIESYLGSFPTYASLPTTISGAVPNDFAHVQEDETHGGLLSLYTIASIDGSGDITWEYSYTIPIDITGKQDIIQNSTRDDLVTVDQNGQVEDSGVPITWLYDMSGHINQKGNLVPNPIQNDIVITDSNGQVQDSGVLITDKQKTIPSEGSFKLANLMGYALVEPATPNSIPQKTALTAITRYVSASDITAATGTVNSFQNCAMWANVYNQNLVILIPASSGWDTGISDFSGMDVIAEVHKGVWSCRLANNTQSNKVFQGYFTGSGVSWNYSNPLGISYSLNEQDIGIQWVDGRHIYQKTVYYPGYETAWQDAIQPFLQSYIDSVSDPIQKQIILARGIRISVRGNNTSTPDIPVWVPGVPSIDYTGFYTQFPYGNNQIQILDFKCTSYGTDYPIFAGGNMIQPSGNDFAFYNYSLDGRTLYFSMIFHNVSSVLFTRSPFCTKSYFTIQYVKN